LLMQAGLYADAYDLLVKNKDFNRAVELIDKHASNSYADTVLVFTKAAEQLASNSSSDNNTIRIVSLYARAHNWDKAGYYSAQNKVYKKAIDFYERCDPKDNEELSKLYENVDNYTKAANYQILADSTAYESIARLYEKGKNYNKVAVYYAKAKMYNNSIACAELTDPKDIILLADTYYAAGNNQKLLIVLDDMYLQNVPLAGDYYKKTGNVDIYRKKLTDSGKYKEILDTYDSNANYINDEVDMLIELSKKADDRSKEVKFTNVKLARLSESIDNMTIEELDDAMKLASDISNNTMKQKFINLKNKEKTRIAKEEKEEKARIAVEEKKAAKDRQDAQAVYQLVGGRYVSSRHPSDEVVL